MTSDIAFLEQLEAVIRQRLKEEPNDSYTAKLAAQGDKRIAQKVGEEAIELAIAAVASDWDEQLNEAADLVFHLLVLLNAKGMRLSDVTRVLQERHRS